MKTTRIALVSALLPLVLGGCGSLKDWLEPTARATPCNSQVCHVEVTVSGGCRVSVDQERIKVGRTHPDVRFIWRIHGAGEFTANGIDLKGAPHFGGKLAGAKLFKWDLRNDRPGNEWKYDVNVSLEGKACPTYDPFIMN